MTLEIKNLNAYYGKSHILHAMNLKVGEGEIVSLLGRNGVGRSTTLKAVMGYVQAKGSIEFNRRQLLGLRPFEIAQAGLGYVPESREIFPTLTVKENLLTGMKNRKPGKWTIDQMYELFPRLKERADAPAGALSGGEQQMLSLCRTLLGDPKLVMIDEPTEGLAPKVVEQVASFLQTLRLRGLSILLVEQKLGIALDISHRVCVMGHGSVVYEGSPDDLRSAKEIRKDWLEV